MTEKGRPTLRFIFFNSTYLNILWRAVRIKLAVVSVFRWGITFHKRSKTRSYSGMRTHSAVNISINYFRLADNFKRKGKKKNTICFPLFSHSHFGKWIQQNRFSIRWIMLRLGIVGFMPPNALITSLHELLNVIYWSCLKVCIQLWQTLARENHWL